MGGSRFKPNEDKNLPLKKNMDSPRKDINNRHGHLNTSLKKEKKNQKKKWYQSPSPNFQKNIRLRL